MKNMTIKSVTKKHFKVLCQLYENGRFTGATFNETVEKFGNMAGFALNERPKNDQELGQVIVELIIMMVCQELSFDPTMPSMDAIQLIRKTVQKEAGKVGRLWEVKARDLTRRGG
ncbi:MAG: hypothetical protein WB948_10835 [Desulfobaccales bacterium]